MKTEPFRAVVVREVMCFALAASLAAALSSPVAAQGAVQAVRQRAGGLGRVPGGRAVEVQPSPEAPPTDSPPTQVPSPEVPPSPGSTAGKLDTTYVSPNASVLVVLRPAQIMTSPAAQFLPTEVATAAGRQYLGIDPVDVDEVVAFYDSSNPLVQAYGVTFKFNKPFRAVNIPQQIRAAAKLSEFNGKKYLQSAVPIMPSFYGPNNKTLILAPDAVLRQVVQSSAQPKSGALLDRVREVPSGSDLYAAINVASLRGLLPIVMGSAGKAIPPEANALLEGTSAAELTISLATRGPISVVLHCNDEAAAQQLETFLLTSRQNAAAAAPGELPGGNEPIKQAMVQFQERLNQRFQPQRNGASVTCLRIEADDPLQPQLLGMVAGAVLTAQALPAMQAAQKAFAQQGGAKVTVPPGGLDAAPNSAVPPTGPEAAGAAAVPPSPETERR